ncbi:hypothetical protein [Hymenobacter koreensis]
MKHLLLSLLLSGVAVAAFGQNTYCLGCSAAQVRDMALEQPGRVELRATSQVLVFGRTDSLSRSTYRLAGGKVVEVNHSYPASSFLVAAADKDLGKPRPDGSWLQGKVLVRKRYDGNRVVYVYRQTGR